MLEDEFMRLMDRLKSQRCENQKLEVKAAAQGCPERLYDTFSSFANQDCGGVMVFGVDESKGFQCVGVYDAQDLQKKLVEVGEAMTPRVCPVLSVFERDGLVFVTAEIPPVDLADRPCFKTGRGRLKGSYVRIGDADKPMTEYEVYSYEAYRRQVHDDLRPVEDASLSVLDAPKLESYLLKRKQDRPNLASLPLETLYDLSGVCRQGKITLAAFLLFSPYPQAFYPQLGIIATCVPGEQAGMVDAQGRRFTDSKRLEGTLPEMLDAAVGFVRTNMKTALRIDRATGQRQDIPEYPLDAVREAVLNALAHRDYSRHTENMPIQLVIYANRLEVINPGGLYGRLTVDDLGHVQPATRNAFLVTMMETLGVTENRYSGIPRMRSAMRELGLPEPVFTNQRGSFSVCFYNQPQEKATMNEVTETDDDKGLLKFCRVPRTRGQIAEFLNIASVQYAIRRYVEPLAQAGRLLLSIPEHPRSSKQTYLAATVPGAEA